MMTREQNPLSPANRAVSSASNTRPDINGTQSNAFARELNRLERKQDDGDKPKNSESEKSEENTENTNGSKARLSGHNRKSGLEQERDGRDDAAFTLDAAIASKLHAGKMAFTAKILAAEVPPAHLEKMAAAIAELVTKGTDAQFTLNLPMGSAMIEGAILGRDASGRIMVQLLSPSILPPHLASQLSADLARRLQDKKLKLGGVAFSKAYTERSGNTVAQKGGA
jgi:hypothetical protein